MLFWALVLAPGEGWTIPQVVLRVSGSGLSFDLASDSAGGLWLAAAWGDTLLAMRSPDLGVNWDTLLFLTNPNQKPWGQVRLSVSLDSAYLAAVAPWPLLQGTDTLWREGVGLFSSAPPWDAWEWRWILQDPDEDALEVCLRAQGPILVMTTQMGGLYKLRGWSQGTGDFLGIVYPTRPRGLALGARDSLWCISYGLADTLRILRTRNQGSLWTEESWPLSAPILHTTLATPKGEDLVMGMFGMEFAPGDGDAYQFLSTDDGYTWSQSPFDSDNRDQRSPELSALDRDPGSLLLFAELYNSDGDSAFNIKFLMAEASQAQDREAWGVPQTPGGVDSLVLADEAEAGPNSLGELRIAGVVEETGGFRPAIAWVRREPGETRLYLSLSFYSLLQKVEENGREVPGVEWSKGYLKIIAPPGQHRLHVFDLSGRELWRGEVEGGAKLRLHFPPGVYAWRLDEARGIIIVPK